MKKLLTLTLVMVMVLGLMGGVAMANNCERQEQGYWKQWLAENPNYECPYGIPTEYLLALLNTPARGDANVILSYQFIAAALNVNVNGCVLPEGTGCAGNNVAGAFNAAFYHLVIMEGESGATHQEILGWKDILEAWNKGYDPGVLNGEMSSAVAVDNGDGTGTVTITLRDAYGCPVFEGRTARYRANPASVANDVFYVIGGTTHLSYATRVTHLGDGVYESTLNAPCGVEDTWVVGIGPSGGPHVIVEEALEISIAPKPVSWTGTWDTEFELSGTIQSAEMTLTQDGNDVTGYYIWHYSVAIDGTIEGVVDGYSLIGLAAEFSYEYPFEFTMSSDGNSFTGTWYWADEEAGFWNGVRQ